MRQIFDEVQKISKFGWFDMPLGSTFEIGTQIILLKIDGFLKGWILNITPLKDFETSLLFTTLQYIIINPQEYKWNQCVLHFSQQMTCLFAFNWMGVTRVLTGVELRLNTSAWYLFSD